MNIEITNAIHSSMNHVPQIAEPIVTCGQAFCLCGGSLNTGFQCMKCGKQYYPAYDGKSTIPKERRND